MRAEELVPYVGKSEYCYANSLRMVLSSHPVKGWEVPSPGELECLSTMPFGELFLDGSRGPEFFFSPANANPDTAIDIALEAVGWKCKISVGSRRTTPASAFKTLQSAVRSGPALVGPVDLGGLIQNPRARYLRGGDHFVVALAVDGEGVTFHDPFGFPHAWLPKAAFLGAWKVGRGYWRGPYTVRWAFRPVRPATPKQMLERTLPRARDALAFDPGGPGAFGSLAALDHLRDLAEKGLPPGLRETLVYFSLPLGARRRFDAARFVAGAKMPELARIFDRQSELLGRVQFSAVQRDDRSVARVLGRFRELETRAIRALS
jgi:hypothetical protein